MTIVQRFWRYLVLASVLLAPSLAVATVWTPTKPTDCTAAQAPTGCCVVAAPGANPACLDRNTAGDLFVVRTDLKSDGGVYGAPDTLTAANFALLGLGSIVYANCTSSIGVTVVTTVDATGKVLKFKLMLGAVESSGAIAASSYLTCDIYGR